MLAPSFFVTKSSRANVGTRECSRTSTAAAAAAEAAACRLAGSREIHIAADTLDRCCIGDAAAEVALDAATAEERTAPTGTSSGTSDAPPPPEDTDQRQRDSLDRWTRVPAAALR